MKISSVLQAEEVAKFKRVIISSAYGELVRYNPRAMFISFSVTDILLDKRVKEAYNSSHDT